MLLVEPRLTQPSATGPWVQGPPETRLTSAGKPITWFVDEQVALGRWRLETIPAGTVGLARDIQVFRASRNSNVITYDWHGDKETFCPPIWWDLAIGSGACGLGCRSCFLMLTHRIKRDPARHLLYDNYTDYDRVVKKWLLDSSRRLQHTMGVGIDRSDSLLYEGVTGHVRRLAPFFASSTSNPKGCRLILLTKSANTRYLEDISPDDRRHVVVTFSLNPEPVADLWEGKWDDGVRITPTIEARLMAAKHAQDLGYEVRVRIDPILTPDNWEEMYADFVSEVAGQRINFRYWTLGTYREKNAQLDRWREFWGLPEMEWVPTDLEHDGTHWHLPAQRRVEIYQTVAKLIRNSFADARVSLCKETHQVRRQMMLCNADCNCLR
jgi:hypothetical protein